MPELSGVSHVSFTVVDMDRTKWFWIEVMGCPVVMEVEDVCLCMHPGSQLAIGFRNHEGAATGPFDETRVGLDHLALRVSGREELERWREWLQHHDVPYSDIVETDLGHHLNLRAPDNVAIELFVLRPEAAAALGAS